MIVTLAVLAVILLVAIIFAVVSIYSTPEDDGLILNNVFAAGVNLSGMTPEEAKNAICDATDDTYTKLSMTVQVLDEVILLDPANTGAKLNVDAVVQAAYDYGRTGSKSDRQKDKNFALTSTYNVPIIDHLNLNIQYIRNTLDALGSKYSTTLTQPSVTVTGEKPPMNQPSYDTNTAYQTLSIYIGTAEYGLNLDDLYEQILDAYNINLFQVAANCTVIAPNSVDVDALYEQYCRAPVDANIDANYNTTPEVYGYGFDLEDVRTKVSNATYGETLEIPMYFIRPSITAEDLSGNLFQDIIGQMITQVSGDNNLLANLIQACKDINGLVLKSGDHFSFNEVIGQPSTRNGYRRAKAFVGKREEEILGGGISQVASTLYVAAVLADMEIVERHHHAYVPVFVEAGLDADISYGTKDLQFTNTSEQPIRIEAAVIDNTVIITIWGTNDKDYTIGIVNEIVRTYYPVDLIQTLPENNPDGALDGDILVSGIIGYDVITYKTYLYSDGEGEPQKYEVGQSHYEKRNQVVVRIGSDEVPDPSDPGDITEPTEPSNPVNPEEP